MSTTTETPLTLEEYKQASRDELEAMLEKIARIEQAADLCAGSLVQGILCILDPEDAGGVIGHIKDGYELKCVPTDWEDRVRKICDGEEAQ